MADSILNYLIKATWQGSDDARKAKEDIKGIGKEGVTARNGLLELQAGLDIAGQALGTVRGVVEDFYGALKEGADLQFTKEKFDALAGSIGVAGDALMNDLRGATKGMVTDAQLAAGAVDLMNLGLVSTGEETVRWSRAVSTLNLDLQVLSLTLANDSRARLDSLGLSMDVVNRKTNKFIALGYEASKAYDLAVLEALEDKMALFGDASETSAGKLQIIETKWKNLTNSVKLGLLEAWEPWIDLMSGEFASTVREIEERNLNAAQATDDWTQATYRTVEGENEIIRAAARSSVSVAEFARKLREAKVQMFDEQTTRAWYDQEQAIMQVDMAVGDLDDRIARHTLQMARAAAATATYTMTAEEMGAVWEEPYEGMVQVGPVLEAIAARTAEARSEFETMTNTVSSMSAIVASGYDAAATAAWDSQRRQAEANAAISESYRQTSLDVFQAKLAETVTEDGYEAADAMIAYQEALGLITPEEAAKLHEVAVKTEAVKTVTEGLFDVYNTDGVLTRQEMDKIAEAVGSIEEGSTLMAEAIVTGAADAIPKTVDMREEFGFLYSRVTDVNNIVAALNWSLTTLPSEVDVTVNFNVNGGVPSVPGLPEPRAGGGPVMAGRPYLVGERGPEWFVPQAPGRIVANGERASASGDTVQMFITGNNAEEIAEQVNIRLARRARLNRMALVR